MVFRAYMAGVCVRWFVSQVQNLVRTSQLLLSFFVALFLYFVVRARIENVCDQKYYRYIFSWVCHG